MGKGGLDKTYSHIQKPHEKPSMETAAIADMSVGNHDDNVAF